ncbi:MAG: STAS domain-containing protein [Cyclobacteriaceae bacterium]
MTNSTFNKYPIHALWDNILFIPIHGIIDSKSGQDIMDSILMKIHETSAKVIILDILGVDTVDSAVANHLIKITAATELMGSTCIISGISPHVAQTIVGLGLDLGPVETQSNLRAAFEQALIMINMEIIKK